jgi:hypothetical protein
MKRTPLPGGSIEATQWPVVGVAADHGFLDS